MVPMCLCGQTRSCFACLSSCWQGFRHTSSLTAHPGSISDLCAGGDWRRCCFILAAEASSIFPDQLLATAMYMPAELLAILGFSCVVAILVGFSFWRTGERP